MKEDKYRIPWWKVNLGLVDIRNIRDAILQKNVTQGILTQKLEKEIADFLGIPFVMLTSSGSSALLAALIAYGIKPQDEVIVPNVTFRATAQIPVLLNVKVKVVDVEDKRPLIDPRKIEKAITSKTKAIIPVHLNGRCANIEEINQIARKYDLVVIEDAAQAFGSKNKRGFVGTQADVGIFSLGITKLITTIQGGVVVSRNKRIYNNFKAVRDFNYKNVTNTKDSRWFNIKFNDIFAAVGLAQIRQIDKKMEQLRKVYSFYEEKIKKIDYLRLIRVDYSNGELPIWIEVFCAEREKVIKILQEKGIQARPMDLPVSSLFGSKTNKNFINSLPYYKYGMILPSGPDHFKKDLEYVIYVLKDIRNYINLEKIRQMHKVVYG